MSDQATSYLMKRNAKALLNLHLPLPIVGRQIMLWPKSKPLPPLEKSRPS